MSIFQDIFANGKSWRSTIAGIVVLIGGIPLILSGAGLAVPVWLSVSGGIASLISTAFGFSQTKDKQVTGVPGAINRADIAVTPLTNTAFIKP
jgi:hypothetical protein